MPAKEAALAVETPQVVEKKKGSYTQWEAFAKAKLVPASVECSGYHPIFRGDASQHCHTKFPQTLENIERHTKSCAGGFLFKLKSTDGKVSPLWAELQNSNLESYDFRCDNCDAQLRFHPSSILPHMKPHGGKTRRVYSGGNFCLHIGLQRPDREELDEVE